MCPLKHRNKGIKSNQGFSLVELIIVIAILAILAGAIAISVIRYINKARKSNDINAAEAIGKSFQNACLKDELMYDYLTALTTNPNMADNPGQSDHFRVIAYAKAVTGRANAGDMDFHLTNATIPADFTGVNVTNEFLQFLTDALTPVKFKKSGKVDQWIICSDKDHNIHVYVGSGMQESDTTMSDDGKVAGRQCYELWPFLDTTYDHFSIPSDIP